jgi:hypothetical protein
VADLGARQGRQVPPGTRDQIGYRSGDVRTGRRSGLSLQPAGPEAWEVFARELTSRGQVFRTDTADQFCAANPAKIRPDADGRAGGCDNIHVTIAPNVSPQITVWHGSD